MKGTGSTLPHPRAFPESSPDSSGNGFTAWKEPWIGVRHSTCELIDRNGDTLKGIVLALAERWTQDTQFLRWIEEANTFCNTLVDGIMDGIS